jgi:hypothetical protein
VLAAGLSVAEFEQLGSRNGPRGVVPFNHLDDPSHLAFSGRIQAREDLKRGSVVRWLLANCHPLMTLGLFVVEDPSGKMRLIRERRPTNLFLRRQGLQVRTATAGHCYDR